MQIKSSSDRTDGQCKDLLALGDISQTMTLRRVIKQWELCDHFSVVCWLKVVVWVERLSPSQLPQEGRDEDHLHLVSKTAKPGVGRWSGKLGDWGAEQSGGIS